MQDIFTMLGTLRRPRILLRAARLGAKDYNRERHLRRVLAAEPPRSAAAIMRLLELERSHDEQRRADDAGYSLSRHLDVLIALMGEARLLTATQEPGLA